MNGEYNDIEKKCKQLGCEHYIEWEFYNNQLISCKLQGESDDIECVAGNCPFKGKFNRLWA